MHGGLLMADQNVPDALLLEQRVIDRQHCAARIAEDHLDAQVLQRPDQYLRSAHFTGRHHKLLFRRSAERRRRYLLKYSASTLLRSEEHTSELQSLMRISYAVFCLKKKNDHNRIT